MLFLKSVVNVALLLGAVGAVGVATVTAEPEPTCRLWLALSNLNSPQLTKFGLYAGVDFDEDTVLPFPEVAMPFVDFFLEGHKMRNAYRKGILEWLESQFWLAEYTGTKMEGNHSATSFVPGVGALSNYHALYSNIEFDQHAAWTQDREGLTVPGQAHPTRGSIAIHHNITLKATRPIRAGMELFANYGDVWDANRDVSIFEDKIVRQDFIDADILLDRILAYFDKFPTMSDHLQQETLDFMLRGIINQAGGFRAKALQALIPNNPKLLAKVKAAGGTFEYMHADMVKTPAWLAQNGLCVDNMEMKPSTIPNAGRGAFARRSIAKDAVITPVPTTIIGDASIMDMFDLKSEKLPNTNKIMEFYDYEKPRSQQIALNYCFGHPESTLLLLPLAPQVNYVNHADEPNAFLRWAEHDKIMNDYATQDNLVRDVTNHRSHLVTLELVAHRDIAPGEEIFIDYGPFWTDAWEDYMSRAVMAQPDTPWPLKAEDLRQVFQTKPYPVAVTDANNPYPAGVVTACFIVLEVVPDGVPHVVEEEETDLFWWGGNTSDLKGADLTYCDLLAKEETDDGKWKYSVRARFENELIQIDHVPHEAVTVVDAPYTSDLHHPEAFRFPIGIPDEMWPQHWRDLR